MKKLNLDKVESYSNFKSPEVGGYVCIIRDVEDYPDKEYLRISYDIAKGDFKGFYTDRAKKMNWSLPTFIRSYKDSALSFFKGFVTSVEESNNGFKWNGTDEKAFINKGVGIVLGDEIYTNQNGEERHRKVVDSIHSVKAIESGDFKVPDVKDVTRKVSGNSADNPFAKSDAPTTKSDNSSSFFDEGSADECPF